MSWTEIQPANLYGAAMGGIAAGNQMADDNFKRRDQHDLRQLAPGVANGDPEALIRATAINPDMAAKYDETHVALVKRAAGAAKYVMEVKKRGGSQQELDGAIRTVGPYLSRITGQPPPDRYDPVMDQHMSQLIATAQGIDGGAKPVDHPSSYDEFELSQSNPAYGAFLAGRQPTQLATISVPGGKLQVQWNPRTRQMTDMEGNPLDTDGSPQAGPPQAPEAAPQPVPDGPSGGAAVVLDNAYRGATDPSEIQAGFKTLAGEFPGTQISSLVRTPERNREVGGVPGSQHLAANGGTAGDFVVPKEQQAAFMARARAQGYEAIDEGDHIHLERPPNRGAAPQGQPQVAQATPYAGRMGFTPDKPSFAAENNARAQQAAERAQQAAEFAQGRATVADERAAAADAGRARGSLPAGWRFRSDGTAERIPGTPVAVPTGQKPTAADNLAAGFYDRMASSERELGAVTGAGYKPGGLRDTLTAGQGVAVNWLASPEGQKYRQAQEDWVRAKLRKESGAAIPDSEMDREIKVYFPQPGDSPGVQKQKERSRSTAIAAMQRAGSRALATSPSAGPAIGKIIEHNGKRYRVTGGDPNDPDVEEVR